MGTNTTNYSFSKPTVDGDEDTWGTQLNGNWDKTDSLLSGGQDISSLSITTSVTLKGQADLVFKDADSSHGVSLQAPATIASNYTLTMPTGDGSNGQVLTTDGSGGLSFTTITGFSGAFGDLTGKPTTISGYGITDALQLGTTSTTALAGNTSIPSTLTDLGISDGTSNQVLSTDGSGAFTFVDQSGGGGSGDSIADADGDTKIQVEESTDDDTIRFDTAGSERLIITPTGNVGINTTTPYDSAWGTDGNNTELAIEGGSTGYGVIHLRGTGAGSTDTRFSMGVGDTKYYMAYDRIDSAHRMVMNTDGAIGFNTQDVGTETLTVAKVGSASYAGILLQGGYDGASKGGFISMAQKDDASTSWNALAGWDNGTHRTIYLGGGNFGQEEATKVQIYAGAYDSGSGGSTNRLQVDSSKVSINYSGADCLDFITSTTNDSRGIAFDGRTALSADSTDGFLRLNNGSEFSNGVYTPSAFRAMGTVTAAGILKVGTSSSLSSTGQLNIYRSANPYIAWYSGSSTRGAYMQYLPDYFLFGEVSYSQSVGSFRAPLFYDSDSTTYVVNPASTSYHKYLGRRAHQTGHLVGGHNNISSTSTKSCPIYTIGSSYNPSESSLGNMYGIGYTHTNATFIGFAGASGWGMYVAADGDARVYLSGQSGSGHFTGNITAYASDERLKTNIKPVENALEKVCQLRGVEFDWVDNITSKYDFHPQTMHETGVLAQNVAEHIPDAVTEAPMNANYTAKNGTDHQFLTVDKEKIIPVLIEAIKELKAEIDMLKGEADV